MRPSVRLIPALTALLLAAPGHAQAQGGDDPTAALQVDAAALDGCVGERIAADADPAGCAGRASRACMDMPGGDTTVGMSHCIGLELKLWDTRLNGTYQALMADARAADAEMAAMGSAAPAQAPALQQAQRDWMVFRDAACTYEETRWGGGSGGGPAAAHCAMVLTAQQFLRLRAYTDQKN